MPVSTTSTNKLSANLVWSLRLQTLSSWLLHLALFITPFLFSFKTSELFEFNKMVAVYVFTTLLVGLLIARSILEKKVLVTKTVLDWVIAVYVGSQLLATLGSIDLPTSIFGYYSRFHGGLLSTLSYVALMYVFASTVSKKQLLGFLATLLIGASLVSLYAIPEKFHFSPSCLLLNQQMTTDCWSEATNPKYRIFGTFGQPNWLAAYAVTLLPIAVFAAITQRKKRLGLLGSISTVLLFTALLFTKSRSGILGFGVAGLVATGLLVLTNWRSLTTITRTTFFKSMQTHTPLLFLGGVLLVIALVFGTPFTPNLATLVQPTTTVESTSADPEPLNRLEVGGTDSGEIRQIVWQGALAVWRRYPLFGSGVETFGYSYYLDRPVEHNLVSEWDFLYNKAHNEFLNLLATTGIVGLGGYVLLLAGFGIVCLTIFFNQKRTVQDRALALSILSGVIGLSVSNFFGFSTVSVSVVLFVFFGIATVLARAEQPEILKRHSTHTVLQWWQYPALTTTGVATLVLLFANYNYWMADMLFAKGQQYLQGGAAMTSIQFFKKALERSPNEATYYSDLSQAYSQVAINEFQAQNATSAAQLAQAALESGSQAVRLNPQQRNFYKSYAQVLIRLSQLNPQLLEQAKTLLEQAIARSPTDARLVYNLALVEEALGNTDTSIEDLQKTIALKANYAQARLKLGQLYLAKKQYELARAEFSYILERIAPGDVTTQALLDQVNNIK